ncbi:MAG: DUF2255 family protein [Solirubrobacteraceae bacterium]
MTAWASSELDRIAAADELVIAARQADGTLRPSTPIWVVRVGDNLYIRSWRGPAGRWFRAVQDARAGHMRAGGVEKDVVLFDAEKSVDDAIDAAYEEKYARYPSYVKPMVSTGARATILKLLPRAADTPRAR